MNKLLILMSLVSAVAGATNRPSIEIRDGKLCIKSETATTTCLYKSEWNDRLKALQEYMREHESELREHYEDRHN